MVTGRVRPLKPPQFPPSRETSSDAIGFVEARFDAPSRNWRVFSALSPPIDVSGHQGAGTRRLAALGRARSAGPRWDTASAMAALATMSAQPQAQRRPRGVAMSVLPSVWPVRYPRGE